MATETPLPSYWMRRLPVLILRMTATQETVFNASLPQVNVMRVYLSFRQNSF
jgi:hypothetical protein